ncbi:hypothetical protein ACWGI7_08580, partial [Streptomyces collinus]
VCWWARAAPRLSRPHLSSLAPLGLRGGRGARAPPPRFLGTRARHCPLPGHPRLDGIGDAEVLAAVAALTGHPAGRGDHTQRGAAV